ncbi:MAG: hypothetical protein AB1756_05395 [Acidobacteriota bacterium]
MKQMILVIYAISIMFFAMPCWAIDEESQRPISPTGRYFQVWNPDISVIGDFLGHYSNKERGFDEEFLLREIELGFTAYVDPYARADIFLGIHKEIPEDVHIHDHEADGEGEQHSHYQLHVEEAYFTFLTLPFNLQAKAGKFRIAFGNVNTQHLHNVVWVEYPLALRNYFGEEGFAGEGLSVSWMIPNPWVHYMELNYEVFNNDQEVLFAGRHADDFVHLLHLKNYWDISENASIEVGLSGMTAPNGGEGKQRTTLEGLDVTFKWRPLREGLYKSFLWQTEVLFCQKGLPDSERADSWGAFMAWTYQFARRWSAGVRMDSSAFANHSDLREKEYSGYITFAQSEYCFWRAGYAVLSSDIKEKDGEHQFFLQLNIGIGPHRAHEY